jgi:hypothetical protein
MSVDMNTFWTDWGVSCGNQSANNFYDCFYGLTMTDGFVCANLQDFLDWNSVYWDTPYNRYSFFKDYENVDSNIIDEHTFYQNTSDVNIWDFKTFYEIAPSYFPANCYIPPVVNQFILAYRNNNKPLISNDGINWNEITISLGNYTAFPNCKATSGDIHLMGGSSNMIRYTISTDTWENFGTTYHIQDLAYNSDTGEFIGITRDTVTNNVHISSDNGETWTTYSSGIKFDCIGYSQGNLKYYASINNAPNSKRVATSSNGITWLALTTSGGGAATTSSKYFTSIDVYGDIYFIPNKPTSGSRYILTTNDFSTWGEIVETNNTDWRVVATDGVNDVVVIMGEASFNSSWKTMTSLANSSAPTTYQYTDVAYFYPNLVWVTGTRASDFADTNKKLLYSNDDGSTWNKIDGTTGTYSNILVIQ